MLIVRCLRLPVCAVFWVTCVAAVPALSINPNNLKLPLAFEREGPRFLARGLGYKIAFDGEKTTIAISAGRNKPASTVSMEFAGEASRTRLPVLNCQDG